MLMKDERASGIARARRALAHPPHGEASVVRADFLHSQFLCMPAHGDRELVEEADLAEEHLEGGPPALDEAHFGMPLQGIRRLRHRLGAV